MATASADEKRLAALRAFDETKTGVKGLVAAGATAVPFFFRLPSPPPLPPPPPPHLSIPTVDLSLPRPLAVQSLLSAARHWGFFQLVNHSVPLPLIRRTLAAVRSFYSLPAADRARHYSRSTSSSVIYNSNLDLFRSAAASWRDTLTVKAPADVEKIPAECREQVMEWDAEATAVARLVMGMLGEGLGIGERRLEEMSCLQGRTMVCHCYPPCPEPELTMGVMDHTDPSILTILLRDETEGLQVKMEEGDDQSWWVDLNPLSDAIIVNVGDLLQIISNDELKSASHRVVANAGKEDGISIAVFFKPALNGESDFYGPLPELLSPEKPPRFRRFTLPEFMGTFFSAELKSRSLADHFRRQPE
ncbi:1-aminocyclopropane-1-carboxylate oxidase like 4 [Apostasia shenzhenica]|uniref:1-aminocyclopropane-1-carboxylate oxidase like 4 n=1 Tax=Apostasia shenzhenica TaxID=1088818 RepID=A0A2I0AQV0_9ASPA|nr:1-aminocyclopropane-1-carboxylate oxidase like 4 [Apostasia shenzhenica]